MSALTRVAIGVGIVMLATAGIAFGLWVIFNAFGESEWSE